MSKRIAILGSTGSIGRQTLAVIEALGPAYRVTALTAGRNAALLAEQARRFKPELVVLSDAGAAAELARELRGEACRVEPGPQGQILAATWPSVDLVVAALVGFSGFEPVLAALQAGKIVALANKESLVVGGELLQHKGLLRGDRIIPMDSEHSAIRQCLSSTSLDRVSRIWLTASGGPFRDWPRDRLESAKPDQALAHPNWRMGAKITVDSATLMNKGFELLEAYWLFGLRLDQIEVVIHPQSVVHSAVEFIDGSVIAQLGLPDMRLPIQYALTYPERQESTLPRLNLFGQNWSFTEPDTERFPCLELAFRAGAAGGTLPACLNAANEVAVEYFLKGELSFGGIPALINAVLQKHAPVREPDFKQILAADQWARQEALESLKTRTGEKI
ncbi:MAG: 1-deoxy-D-xylulose-5-phosphate reductoisomerase [Bacillota bacterium]